MKAPEQFMQNMQTLLGEDYQAYAASFLMPSCRGLRLNTVRKIPDLNTLPFLDGKIAYVQNGYYLKQDAQPAKHPYHAAGLYYLQEPSAMLPADRLPIEEGDFVLDLCAAPGGKSTQILSKLNGSGLLLANDLSVSRAGVLLKNLVLSGNANYFVSAEEPATLAKVIGPVFDKILVDAPCSGEGMFRRDPDLMKDWEKRGPSYYAPIQREILKEAVKLLKPGGMLMYSTCTFAPEENEENIIWLLDSNPDLKLINITCTDGISEGLCGLNQAARCFPHRMKGEGHFLCLLQKNDDPSEPESIGRGSMIKTSRIPESVSEFLKHIKKSMDADRIRVIHDKVYLFPKGSEKVYHPSLRFLRTGLLLGTLDKRERFRPDQALALSLKAEDYDAVINCSLSDDRVGKYLKGETVFVSETDGRLTNGIALFAVDHYALGFVKIENGRCKNLLAPGFIRQ